MEGELQIHGHLYSRTWTRLAAPAAAGSSTLYLQHATNWEAGQVLLITTTTLKDARDWHRNEKMTISSIDATGKVVTLTGSLAYHHEASAAYQAEVALLTRRIVIQGAEADSRPTDATPVACTDSRSIMGSTSIQCEESHLTGYGGHVVAMGENATLRVAGVELLRMGQTNVMGRYPLHMHLMGAAGGVRSYIKDCAIHEVRASRHALLSSWCRGAVHIGTRRSPGRSAWPLA